MDRNDQENYVLNKQRVAELEHRQARIRQLNHQLRTTLSGGRVMLTPGISELGITNVAAIINEVRKFTNFSEDNDPHREHDFGAVDVAGQRIFWKIDYYDKQLEYGSPDPSNPDVTARVLTIMLASEY